MLFQYDFPPSLNMRCDFFVYLYSLDCHSEWGDLAKQLTGTSFRSLLKPDKHFTSVRLCERACFCLVWKSDKERVQWNSDERRRRCAEPWEACSHVSSRAGVVERFGYRVLFRYSSFVSFLPLCLGFRFWRIREWVCVHHWDNVHRN